MHPRVKCVINLGAPRAVQPKQGTDEKTEEIIQMKMARIHRNGPTEEQTNTTKAKGGSEGNEIDAEGALGQVLREHEVTLQREKPLTMILFVPNTNMF